MVRNTDIAILQLPYNMLNIFYRNRVNTSKWLIEHDKLWVNSQATGNLCTLSIFYYEIIDVKNLFIRFIIELFVVVRGEFSHSSIAIS